MVATSHLHTYVVIDMVKTNITISVDPDILRGFDLACGTTPRSIQIQELMVKFIPQEVALATGAWTAPPEPEKIVINRGTCQRGYGIRTPRCEQYDSEGTAPCAAATGPGGYCPHVPLPENLELDELLGLMPVTTPVKRASSMPTGGEHKHPPCRLGLLQREEKCTKRDGNGSRACVQAKRVLVDGQHLEGPCPWLDVGDLPPSMRVLVELRDGIAVGTVGDGEGDILGFLERLDRDEEASE